MFEHRLYDSIDGTKVYYIVSKATNKHLSLIAPKSSPRGILVNSSRAISDCTLPTISINLQLL